MLTAIQGGSIKAVRKFLYVGFMHEDAKLTEKEVGSWFDMSDIPVIIEKINIAMESALPPAEEKADETADPNAQSPANPE